MEKEVYSKASQADMYPKGSQTPYETFGDMFQSIITTHRAYLQGLKYHMKEHMGFGESTAALQALYGQPFRKVTPITCKNPQSPESGVSLDLSDPSSQKTSDPNPNKSNSNNEADESCPSFQCLHSGASSSSSSSPVIVQKGKYECFYCDFSNLNNGNTPHKKQKPERMLPCDKCDYFTALTSSLKSHMLKHTSVKPLKCQYCDYSTKHMSALKLHVTKHTGILQYSCGQCSYRTASSSSLKSHMLKHTDVKHLKCPFCDYSTKHKNALKMHMCKHSGILEHACPDCDYRTASSSYLKSHMLKHSDLRPQKCAYCEYSTKHKSALKNHLKKHVTLPFCSPHVII